MMDLTRRKIASFALGMASLGNWAGASGCAEPDLPAPLDDSIAIAQDWAAVGGDLSSAMSRLKRLLSEAAHQEHLEPAHAEILDLHHLDDAAIDALLRRTREFLTLLKELEEPTTQPAETGVADSQLSLFPAEEG